MSIVFDDIGEYVSGTFDFEEATWPLKEGDEIRAVHFKDVRKHIYCFENRRAGYYMPDPLYDPTDHIAEYSGAEAEELAWQYGRTIWYGDPLREWICVARDRDTDDQKYGLWKSKAWGSQASWDQYAPPSNINPSIGVWKFSTSVDDELIWVLAPDRNRYSDFDKYSPTHIASMDGPTAEQYLYLSYAQVELPEQMDPLRTHNGLGDNADGDQGKNRVVYEENRPLDDIEEGDFTRYYHNMKEFLRRYITQIESLGTSQTVNQFWRNPSGHFGTDYILSAGQFAGDFPNGNPMNPESGPINGDVSQILFEPKICAAYQNAVIRSIENAVGSEVYLPVDNDYKNNRVQYDQWQLHVANAIFDDPPNTHYHGKFYDGVRSLVSRVENPGDGEWHIYRCIGNGESDGEYYPNGVWNDDHWELWDVSWDESRYEGHLRFASIRDPFWGCNESGYECLLKFLGIGDWWFDTKNVYFPKYIREYQEATMDEGDGYTIEEINTAFPLPIGTFRLTFRYSFGRVDMREINDYLHIVPQMEKRIEEAIAQDIEDITQVEPISVEIINHPYITGDVLEFAGVDGPVELNGETYLITVIDEDNFTLDNTEAGDFTWPYVTDGTVILVGPDQHALHKSLMRPANYGIPRQNAGCSWKNLTPGLTIDPVIFSLAEQMAVPWSGLWEGATKHEQWVGHNWDGLDIRQNLLPYFDGKGETYDQYDPVPDYDGRPVFDMRESLREIEEPDENEETLIVYMDELVDRHDMSEKANGVREYEIKALMVNDLRMIMMSSRRRSQDILATLERKLFQEDFYYGSSPTTQDLIDAYDLALEALVGSNTPAPFDSPTLSSNSENFDIWWELAEQTSGDNMRALYGRKQIKFLEYTIQGALTSSNVYARFSLEYVAVSISSGTGDHANAVIDIEGGVLGKTVISHNLDYHSQHQPVSHYWIELGNYGTEEEPSPWLAINLYAEDSGYPTNPPPEAPPDENMLMQAKLKCSFKNLLLFMHNWDLLKPEVFGIPSDKGLKQIEGVS